MYLSHDQNGALKQLFSHYIQISEQQGLAPSLKPKIGYKRFSYYETQHYRFNYSIIEQCVNAKLVRLVAMALKSVKYTIKLAPYFWCLYKNKHVNAYDMKCTPSRPIYTVNIGVSKVSCTSFVCVSESCRSDVVL